MPLPALRSLLGNQPRPTSNVRRNRPLSRPGLETLEDRRVLSTVLTVDDNRMQDPHAQFTTISAAVAAAQPGDTIRVFAGTYQESVTVNKSLTFVADHHGGNVVVNPGTAGSGFNVQADNVRIFGFTIEDATGAAGITLSRSNSGADIENNVLRDNTFGIYLNSSGASPTVIRHNAFISNNAAGSASGNGIYSDQGVTNARIEGNYFTGQQNAAMIFVGNGTAAQAQSRLQIRGNAMIDDAPIILVNTTSSTISGNLSLRSSGSGIFFGGGVSGVTVSNNVLRDGAFTGINLRTDSANYPVSAPNTNNVIRNNLVSGFGDSGIRLREGASGNLVVGNTVVGNGTNNDATTGDGISLENADNNVIRGNVAEHNRRDGIRVDADSTGNRIEGNRLRFNGEFDARDDSTGSGTAGTANQWVRNVARTTSPFGLGSRDNGHGHGHDHDDDDHHHGDDGDDHDRDD